MNRFKENVREYLKLGNEVLEGADFEFFNQDTQQWQKGENLDQFVMSGFGNVRKPVRYEPFKNCEELIKECRSGRFGNGCGRDVIWVEKFGEDSGTALIEWYQNDKVKVANYGIFKVQEMFKNFNFTDGTPFGKTVS